ncbi:hypothetical protein AFEL58S_02046 [Afipia felis]
MNDGSFDLQWKVFAALEALSPPLASGGIHAPAPQDTPLPYIEIGEGDTVTADIQGRDGLDETITIYVWTIGGSFQPAKDIISRIRGALHAQKLTVPGRSAALAFIGSTRLFADADGESVHGVISLRVNHFGQLEV